MDDPSVVGASRGMAPGLPRADVPGLSPQALRAMLHGGQEMALLDIREHGQFGESHLFYATPLPYSRLEIEVLRLVPRLATPVVLVGEAMDGLAQRAAYRLKALGYTQIFVLAGGTAAWAEAGYPLFEGVNLPSKTFGEVVERELHTPRIGPAELAARQARGDKLIVLDGRPYGEFLKMNIPGAICCPNGELALRIGELAPDPQTTVVINCAGRTRSIIGAQTLINFGIPNPVFALENGTQGWFLADLTLEHGNTRRHGDNVSPPDLAQRQERARTLAARHGVPFLDAAGAQDMIDDVSRTTVVLDVRTPAEFAAGSLSGAQHAPGGQLLQATDQYVGVRHARLLLVDDEGVRAPVVASWLRQMGHEAFVLSEGIRTKLRMPPRAGFRAPAPDDLALEVLLKLNAAGSVAVLDVRSGMAYRSGHLPGARWTIRPKAPQAVSGNHLPCVLVADDRDVAGLIALDLAESGLPVPRLCMVSAAGLKAAGVALEVTPDLPADADCIDYLFFVHDRHDGNKDAARRYLAWETGLIAKLDEQDLASFRIS